MEYAYNDTPLANLITNSTIADLYTKNAQLLNFTQVAADHPLLKTAGGSTDIGNVSHTVPSIHAQFSISPENVNIHTREFAACAGTIYYTH